jgi:hypothetical protein
LKEVHFKYDCDRTIPEPTVELGEQPVIHWGPRTSLNHVDEAELRIKAWLRAREEGAPASEVATLAQVALTPITKPVYEEAKAKRTRTPKSPSAPETQGELDLGAPKGEEKEPKVAAVKLPRTKLKLKI